MKSLADEMLHAAFAVIVFFIVLSWAWRVAHLILPFVVLVVAGYLILRLTLGRRRY